MEGRTRRRSRRPGGLSGELCSMEGRRVAAASERPQPQRERGKRPDDRNRSRARGVYRPTRTELQETSMSIFSRADKLRMPTADEALPGRAERPFAVPARHFVLGTPLEPPFPEGYVRAMFGM